MDECRSPENDDSEWIARAQAGDQDAFGALYQRYVQCIYRYVRSRVNLTQDAEDLTEQVFLLAFLAIDRYQERGHPYSAYLYQIARNQITDFYRLQKQHVDLGAADEVLAQDQAIEGQISEKERAHALESALGKLPQDYQEVIRLRILLELSTNEAAAWLKRSEGATRVLLYRALRTLRKLLDHEQDPS